MLRYRIVDRFATTATHYWDVFFDADYNRGLYEALDMDYELLELRREGEGSDETIVRRVKLVPRRELPAVMRKFVSGAISYEQRDRFSRRDDRVDVETIPNYLADRFVSKGIYRLLPAADGVERVWEGECACKVPLVGGAIEKLIVDEVQRGYTTTTSFTRDWLARHPASAS